MDKYLSLRLRAGFAAWSTNRLWITNSGSIFATTLLGSALGFAFWTAASHRYTPTEIGLGAAWISALTLIAALGDMGLGVMLVRYSAAHGKAQAPFFNTLLLLVAASTLLLALVFIAVLPAWSPEMSALLASRFGLPVFVLGTLAFASAQFYDRLFIARQASHCMFWRSLSMHASRLVFMLAFLGDLGAIGLIAAVGLGALVSLVSSIWILAPHALPGYRLRPHFQPAYLTGKIGYTLGNHLSQLVWSLPPMIYPLLVINMLGAAANARFYTSWMVANLLFMIPLAVSTASFATASSQTSSSAAPRLGPYWRAMRLTLLALVPVSLVFALFTRRILSLFGAAAGAAVGASYSPGDALLVLFSLSVFPYTLNTFVITAHRLGNHVKGLICLSAAIAVLSIACSLALCRPLGLVGIGWGWLAAQSFGVLLAFLGYLASLRGSRYGRRYGRPSTP